MFKSSTKTDSESDVSGSFCSLEVNLIQPHFLPSDSESDEISDRDSVVKSAPKSLKTSLLKKSKVYKNMFKKQTTHSPQEQQTPADAITEEERLNLRGGRNTRDAIEKNATKYYNHAMVYLKFNDYEMAQTCFEKVLRLRLMLNGADHKNILEIHEKLGEVAMNRGNESGARNHIEIAERIRAACSDSTPR
uniref:Kinesin light chain n=1 Tax=Helicotheca tamesis TaxID=374047 RepID=A0A7S2I9S7_9STRA|mmetsp:Transcript_7009/g.9483  ORF Transcript_7009/g.9483 Transcript_7009/m.9483 type:complete len:191 (+) Transcript_7009:123-695(+)